MKMSKTPLNNVFWISRYINLPTRTKNTPFKRSLVFFALPLDIVILLFIFFRHQQINVNFYFPMILVIIWINFAPYLIWYYDQKITERFFTSAKNLITNKSQLSELSLQTNKVFVNNNGYVAIPWMTAIFFVYLTSTDTMQMIGFNGLLDPWYWVLTIFVLWIGYLMGIGLWGVLTTIHTITKIADLKFNIDPLHKDRVGGLSCIGQYALSTTFLFSSGSLILPILVQGGSEDAVFASNVYILITIYIIFVLISFVYPTAIVNIKAKTMRDEILEKLGNQCQMLTRKIQSREGIQEKNFGLYFELGRIRSLYDDFSNVKLYPFKTEFITSLGSSLLFPIVLMLIQQML